MRTRAGIGVLGAIAAAALLVAAPAPAHPSHGKLQSADSPEQTGVEPGQPRPGDRVIGGIHSIPIRRGGLLDYGTLPDGTRILSHGGDPVERQTSAMRRTDALYEGVGLGGIPGTQTDSTLPPIPSVPVIPPAPQSGFSQVDNALADAIEQANGIIGNGPAAPDLDPPIDCYAPGTANTYEPIYYVPKDAEDQWEQVAADLRLEAEKGMRRMSDEATTVGSFYRSFKVETETIGDLCRPKLQHINGTQPSAAFGSVVGDLAANFGKTANTATGNRKYLVYVQGTVPGAAGQGTAFFDESKQASNQHNTRTGYALVFSDAFGTSGRTTLHEVSHNLGAVQPPCSGREGAPHNNTLTCTSVKFHCTDENDRLCQNDPGGRPPVNPPVCADREWYDCNHDDYFNPNPPAGSYLARKYDLANDSVFVEQTDVTDPVLLDTDVKDVSPAYANETLAQQLGPDYGYKVKLRANAADNWGIAALTVTRSGRLPFSPVPNAACPAGGYPVGTTFVYAPTGQRIETIPDTTDSFGITKPGCYRFDIAATDRAGRVGHYFQSLKVSTPQDHAVQPVRDLAGL